MPILLQLAMPILLQLAMPILLQLAMPILLRLAINFNFCQVANREQLQYKNDRPTYCDLRKDCNQILLQLTTNQFR
jgi:hypothetical protein